MITLGLVLMIIGSVLAAGAFGYLFYRVKKLSTAIALEAFDLKKEYGIILGLIVLTGLGTMMFFLGIPYYWHTDGMLGYEWACIILGALLLGGEFSLFITTFRLHYYQLKYDERTHKALYYIMIVCLPLMVLTIWMLTEGYANHMSYPLINGISFINGLHFTHAGENDTNIAWYALCILGGAVLVYFICDHNLYKEYGKHGLVDSTFLLAFPAGIIGARIAYVIGEWDSYKNNFVDVFKIWEGGLTILGGAIAGIVVGVLWFHHKNKDIPIGRAVDLIVPTILVAQGIGRFGNFFNAEVHGVAVDGAAFRWLPTIFYNQLQYSSGLNCPDLVGTGQIYAPLFIIETMTNLLGYFVLAYVFGRWLKKYIKNGDLCFGYIIWYGLTRVFMEPLRHPDFNMGTKGAWSWIWSIIFAAVGILLIVINHVARFIKKEIKNPEPIEDNKKKRYFVSSIIGIVLIAVISLTLFGVGLYLYVAFDMANAPTHIALVPHNVGLILWIVGLFLFTAVSMPILYLVKVLIPNKKESNTVEKQ